MSRRVGETRKRRAAMCGFEARNKLIPTKSLRLVFARYGLSQEARVAALAAADRSPRRAAECYAAIARSLVPR